MHENNRSQIINFDLEVKLKGFVVYEVNSEGFVGYMQGRKDYYKINFTTGKFIFHYADRSIKTNDSFLLFANPQIPYSCEVISQAFEGFSCLFTEEFLKLGDKTKSILQSSLFKIGGTPIFELNEEQKEFITSLFKKMLADQNGDYIFKGDLIRNYINLIIHETIKMQPLLADSNRKNASQRIATVFLELLERQFPIERIEQPLELKTAQDFANHLNIHVNYLNSAVKKATGKSTSTHIADRIIVEAIALLNYTNWNITEIAFSLGFEYPTYFNKFFKKKTGKSPTQIRQINL